MVQLQPQLEAQVLVQARRAQALVGRVVALYSDDKIARILTGSVVFPAGSTNYRDIVLMVPSDKDFYAQKFELLLDVRQIIAGSAPPISDLTFRPFDWNCGDNELLFTVQKPVVTFALLESSGRVFQSAPLSIAFARSTRHNDGGMGPWTSAQGSGIPFRADRRVSRGSAVTVRVTPNSFYPPTPPVVGTAMVLEYRVTANLSGYYKRV